MERHEANELDRVPVVLSGRTCSIVEYEIGVNNPLRRLAPPRRRDIIWWMQAVMAAYPAWQACLVQRTKYAACTCGL